MAWTTPKTNWSNTDALDNTDVNKRESNLEYLKTQVDGVKQDWEDNIDQGLKTTDTVIFAEATISGDNVGTKFDYLNQDVKSTAFPVFGNFAAGSYNDQDVRVNAAPTFLSVNTGQGDHELYDMDQDVKTTDKPTFAGVILNETSTGIIDLLTTGTYTFAAGFWQFTFSYSLESGDEIAIQIWVTDAWETLFYIRNVGGSIATLSSRGGSFFSTGTNVRATASGTPPRASLKYQKY